MQYLISSLWPHVENWRRVLRPARYRDLNCYGTQDHFFIDYDPEKGIFINRKVVKNVTKAIQIDDKDNVATVTGKAVQGDEIDVLNPDGSTILRTKTAEDLPFGHKIAIKEIHAGVDVVKYGEIIGVASEDIPAGKWVHTHNVKSARLDTSEK